MYENLENELFKLKTRTCLSSPTRTIQLRMNGLQIKLPTNFTFIGLADVLQLVAVKIMFQEDKLKVAILDYLKRYHPADTDTLTMVSLHYTLYLQIAQALEERAQGILGAFTTKTLGTPQIIISETVTLKSILDALCGIFSVILLLGLAYYFYIARW